MGTVPRWISLSWSASLLGLGLAVAAPSVMAGQERVVEVEPLVQPDFGVRFRLDGTGVREIPSVGLRARLGLGPAAVPHLADVIERLEDEARRTLRETSIPALSIALVRAGEVVWADAFGLANVATGTPATADTYFSTGSTLKPVTAAAVMQLVDEGLLALDDPFNDLVPEALRIEGADDVTLRHLLAHYAGLEGPVEVVSLWGREPIRSPEETIRATRRVGPPGLEYEYCNACYTMAGYVVELRSGMAFDAFLTGRIFGPLGAEFDAPSVPAPALVERLALPYGEENGHAIPIEQIRTNVFAAGDTYLRPKDMAGFLAAILNGGTYRGLRILSARSSEEILQPQFGRDVPGLGFNRSEVDGRGVVTKNGIFTGYHSFMIGDPATRHGAYVVANSTEAGPVVASLARLALRLLWGQTDPAGPDGGGASARRRRLEHHEEHLEGLTPVERVGHRGGQV